MNVFVGLNDVGKSNFLKALNLFFNGQTDYGVDFDFNHDFSQYFPKKSHAAQQILIEIKFDIPSSFSDSGVYTWTKIWRRDNYFREEITSESGEKPSDRSRIPSALKRIKFRYVPAVKSQEYYKSLLGDLYNTVSSVIDSPLESSITDFSTVLQDYTSQISTEVYKKVGINSVITFPEDLNEIFRNLIFQTTIVGDIDNSVPLSKRGDGIQARHIPIILKYIADEDQKTRTRGSMKVHTIWGYEEPENGIELSMAYDLADNFREYSSEIQMFITSHSPSFYLNAEEDTASQVFFVIRNADPDSKIIDGTKVSTDIKTLTIGKTMGLLPVVAPYMKEIKQQLDNQMRQINEMKKIFDDEVLIDIPTILVEGITDKKYLALAIELFSSPLGTLLHNSGLRIFTKKGEGGCSMVGRIAGAWIYSKYKSKCVALFDKDKAAGKAKREMEEMQVYTENQGVVLSRQLVPSPEIKEIYKKGVKIQFEIEHLLSVECWSELVEKEYVEERSIPELLEIVEGSITPDQSPYSVIETLFSDFDSEFVNTIIKLQPKSSKKTAICNYVIQEVTNGRTDILKGLWNTVQMLERILIK